MSYSFEDENKDNALMEINKIINKKPYNMDFYSNNYLAEDEIEEGESSTYLKKIEQNDELLKELKDWQGRLRKHITTLQLHAVLNKFFNNINVLKGQSLVKDNNPKKGGLSIDKLIANNTPWQVFQRIVIIFINAVASIEKKGTISNSNIATSLKSFNWEDLENTSQTYRDNIKELKDNKNSLVNILFEHPIIKRILKNEKFDDIKFEGKKVTYKEIKDKLLPRLRNNIDEDDATTFYNQIKENPEFLKEYNQEKIKKDKNGKGTKEYIVEEKRIK